MANTNAVTIIYLRDDTLNLIGIIEDYTILKMILRHADVSTWTLTMPGGTDTADAITQPGYGIVVVRNGVTILSGNTFSNTETGDANKTTLVVVGNDDTDLLLSRLALPTPNGVWASAAYDTLTGPGETLILHYIDVNCGPGSVAARRDTRLTLPATLGRGTSLTAQARFDNLMDFLRGISIGSGDLGFRVIQQGLGLTVQVYVPRDRTAEAQFSYELGNLRGHTMQYSSPTTNVAYVAGGGEGTARIIDVETNSVSITADKVRRETFVDQRQTTDMAVLAQKGQESLVTGAPKFALKMTPIDTEGVTFNVDYGLGDLVTCMGQVGVVRDLTLTVDKSRETLEPLVGGPGSFDPQAPDVFRERKALGRRINKLERQ